MNPWQQILSRRDMLRGCALTVPAMRHVAGTGSRGKLSDHTARYWRPLNGGAVECLLCPWQCIVAPGKRGRCQARENVDGRYVSLIYGRIVTVHSDPIEKKPFYHVLPGQSAFSMATASCNLDCSFCQNWTLARRKPEDLPNIAYTPEQVVSAALDARAPVVAYTYNEPTIYQEFIVDATENARAAGLHTVMVSNGFINRKPLKEVCKLVDAYKIDLKSFTEEYYDQVVHGRLRPVLDSLVTLREAGVWTEIVYLVVPTLNDQPEMIRQMAKWIVQNLGADVPVHFSRFVPQYRLKHLPPTPVKTLELLRDTALDAGLSFVYLGNVPGHAGGNTYCPSCGKLLIRRVGYRIYENHLSLGACPHCQRSIPGVWKPLRGES